MRPHVVRGLRTQDEALARQVEPVVVRHVISEQTARTLLEMLTSVVDEGTGKAAAVPGTACGQDGTAQKVDPATGATRTGRLLRRSSGRFRRRAPRLVILV